MEKDDKFWLRVSLIVFTAIATYVYLQAWQTLGIQTGWVDRYDYVFGTLSYPIAIVLAVLTTYLVNAEPERRDYFLNSIGELRKVVWPSREDTQRMTIVVCIVVAFFGVVLFVFDLAWAYVLRQII